MLNFSQSALPKQEGTSLLDSTNDFKIIPNTLYEREYAYQFVYSKALKLDPSILGTPYYGLSIEFRNNTDYRTAVI